MLFYGMDDGSSDSPIQYFQVQGPDGIVHGIGGSKQLFLTDEEIAEAPDRVLSMSRHFLIVMHPIVGMSVRDDNHVGDFGKQVPGFKVPYHSFAGESSDLVKDVFFDDGVDGRPVKNLTGS